MADLRKKMSLDKPPITSQILTAHDATTFRNLHQQQQQQHQHQQHHGEANVNTSTQSITVSSAPATASFINKSLTQQSNMVVSSINLEHARTILIPASAAQSAHQQRITVTGTANGFLRGGNNSNNGNATTTVTTNLSGNNFSSILPKTKILTTAPTANVTGKIVTNNQSLNLSSSGGVGVSIAGTIPTASKYVFVQQNSNGQYTTIEGTAAGAAAAGGSIVLLSAEALTAASNGANGEQPTHIITTSGGQPGVPGTENDEELRPLQWLSQGNILSKIVTTNPAGNPNNTNGILTKRAGTIINTNSNNHHNNNIYVVNDIIEELPAGAANEEHVITTTTVGGGSDVVDSALPLTTSTSSAAPAQHQTFISGKRILTTAGTLANFTLATHESNNGSTASTPTIVTLPALPAANSRNDGQHIFNNIATTSLHFGPSGSTTVVEYKAANGNLLTAKQLVGGTKGGAVNAANHPTGATVIQTANYVPLPSSSICASSSAPVSYHTSSALNNGAIVATAMQKPLMSLANSTASAVGNGNTNTTATAIHLVTTGNGTIYQSAQTPSPLKHVNVGNHNNNNNSTRVTTNNIYTSNNNNNVYTTALTTVTPNNVTLPAAAATITPQSASSSFSSSASSAIITATPTTAAVPATSTTSTTTIHHPHKKYLREKMNVLDHGGGGTNNTNNNNNSNNSIIDNSNNTATNNQITIASTNNNNNSNAVNASSLSSSSTSSNAILYPSSASSSVPAATVVTVVSSPASSSNSLSSSASSSLSTAAVNGGNSPISKPFFALCSNSNTSTPATISLNYASNSSSHSPSPSSSSPATVYVATSMPTSVAAATVNSSAAISGIHNPITIVNQPTNVVFSSVVSSPDVHHNTKDYSIAANVVHNGNTGNATNLTQQLNHQQQIHNHVTNRSPTSYSSYDNDSLKDFEILPPSNDSTSSNVLRPQQQQQHHSNSSLNNHQQGGKSTSSSSGSSTGQSNVQQKQKHPTNVPYDPLVHTHNKPPYSFSSLIFMAIEGSQEKALPVKEIYAWIVQHFPYFKTAPTGWKNSVRHNLSLNKSFVKVEKAPNMGKGSLWRVEQQQRQSLIQALTRSPFFPNSAVDKINLKGGGNGNANGTANSSADSNASYDVIDGSSQSSSNDRTNVRFDQQLFPYLSKTFKNGGALCDVPNDEDPSDYSTSNQQHNHNNNNNNSNNNNTKRNTNKYNYYQSSPMQNGNSTIENGDGVAVAVVANNNNNNTNGIQHAVNGSGIMNYENLGVDSIDDVNAATAMLALKHGPKIFSEAFHNGAPVITSSPSEDHTYSAGGGSTGTSGASTPLTNVNPNSQLFVINGTTTTATAVTSNGFLHNHQNGCDSHSTCASSDAAYESSEENHHNVTPEELEDRKRHRDGVDALLSLSLSASCSPIKRLASTSVEDEHLASINGTNATPGKMALSINNNNNNLSNIYSPRRDEGYNTSSATTVYYNSSSINNNNNTNNNGHIIHNNNNNNNNNNGIKQKYFNNNNNLSNTTIQSSHFNLNSSSSSSSSSPPKKIKTLRFLRNKFKRKAPWKC